MLIKYVPGDVTSSATSKSKLCCPASNVSNWINNLYTLRLLFRKKTHELPNSFAAENGEDLSELDAAASYILFIRDSATV